MIDVMKSYMEMYCDMCIHKRMLRLKSSIKSRQQAIIHKETKMES